MNKGSDQYDPELVAMLRAPVGDGKPTRYTLVKEWIFGL